MPIQLFHGNLEEARKKLLHVSEGKTKDDKEKKKLISEALGIIETHRNRTVQFENQDQSVFQRLLELVKEYDSQLDDAASHLDKSNPDILNAIYRLLDCHNLLNKIVLQTSEIAKVMKNESKELE